MNAVGIQVGDQVLHGVARLRPMKEKDGEHPFGDTGQLILFGLFAVLWAADSFVLQASTFAATRVPLAVRLGVAAPMLVLALYLVWAAHVVILHGRPRHIVTSGVYRYVRHPMYLGTLLVYLSLALATASLLSCVLLLGIFLFYDYIARYEERLLLARFGEEYRRYRDRTGKWVPHCSRDR